MVKFLFNALRMNGQEDNITAKVLKRSIFTKQRPCDFSPAGELGIYKSSLQAKGQAPKRQRLKEHAVCKQKLKTTV